MTLAAFRPVSVLHVSAKGQLTLCGLAVAFAGDFLTFTQVVRDFEYACAEFKRRGCVACRDALREALENAR